MVRSRLQILLAGILAMAVVGCSRGPDQSSPQAVLDSAQKLVQEGEADRLPDLIWAESPGMRRVLDTFGRSLSHLQELADLLQEKFPDEVEEVKEELRERVESGEAGSMIGQLMAGARPQRRETDRRNPGAAATRALKQVFADPYGWLEEQSERLSVVTMTDEQAAVLWDGQPVFGPLVGLTMHRKDGEWYVVLPMHVVESGLGRKFGEEDWEIIETLFVVLDNTITDTIDDVRSGRAKSLEEAATIAGENTLMPMMFVALAWGKMQEEMAQNERPADIEPAAEPDAGEEPSGG